MTSDTQTPLERIEALTAEYSAERDQLRDIVTRLQQRIEALRRRALPRIREAVRRTAEARDRLQSEIQAHPELWEGRRRTIIIAGVRVGLAKGRGRLVWDDAAQVVRLIRREFPDRAEALIRTREEPIRSALAELSVAELRRIGVHVEDTDDQIVIRPTDTEVDRLVDALLRDAERLEEDAA